jgi:hypothetical protein
MSAGFLANQQMTPPPGFAYNPLLYYIMSDKKYETLPSNFCIGCVFMKYSTSCILLMWLRFLPGTEDNWYQNPICRNRHACQISEHLRTGL